MKNVFVMFVFVIGISSFAMAGHGKPQKANQLVQWISKNLIYPEAAFENREQGVVLISFTVSAEGTAEHVKVEEGVSEKLDKAALETVENMPLENLYNSDEPDKQYLLPIRFSIK
jgi:TonB family protein